jgi:ferric-dicitrate binding protein FerR (iron transport regulator)
MEQSIQHIITNVLEGNSTPDERRILTEWVRLSESNRKEFEQSEAIWNALEINKNQENFDYDKGFARFMRSISKSQSIQPLKRSTIWSGFFVRIAASILLVLGSSLVTYLIVNKQSDEVAYFELTTPKGSQTQIALTDGTKIWLNAESKLRYPSKFTGETRTVYLEGEAFFNVKKDPEHPFVVHTADIKVKALGTSFNVKAYPGEGSIETTLVNGVVIVEGAKTEKKLGMSIKLTPNQKATFIKTKGKLLINDSEAKELTKSGNSLITERKESLIVTKKVNTELYTSWVENRLIFENEPFESIALKLERRYGAAIRFRNDRYKSVRFSGKFPEISIDRALKALQYASPFDYEIKHDTIYIK